MDDRYGTDVLAAGWRDKNAKRVPRVAAEHDMVVEVATDGWCGAVTSVKSGHVELEDRHGRRRLFPLGPGFMVDGQLVELGPPAPSAPSTRPATARTASGSFAVADAVARGPHGAHTLIVGHPFIDVWQCVTPQALGIRAWPEVPRGTDWKTGVCRGLGWPSETPADLARAWRRVLGAVSSYRDLEPALLGRVEELIDFVTS